MKTKTIYSIPEEVAKVAKTLEDKGFEAYLIGGCVRDILLERKPKDWDITTNATPEEIIPLFPNTFYENDYGTVGIVNEETKDETVKVVEVTPYREETGYSDNRRPDKVVFGKKLEDDLKRRDFTINAIALKLEEGSKGKYKGHLVDLYEGQSDLQECVIRAVGKPDERFKEDALRMLRAVRLSSELGFTIEPETEKSILEDSHLLKNISMERIRDEFSRVTMSDNPKSGLELAQKLGLLQYFLPELAVGIGIDQNQAHSFDVWEHSLRTIQHSAKKGFSLEIRLASLFHDIGKPKSRRWSDQKKDWTFYGHDVIGSRVTEKILKRLKFPSKLVDKVTKMVRWHMFFSDTEQITLSAVRRLIVNVGKENVWDLMNVRACDRIGTGRPKESPYRLRKYHSMVEEAMRDPVTVGMLKIGGKEIIEVTHETPGPRIGYVLHALLEDVLDDPKKNTTKYLSDRAIELSKLSDKELEKIGESGKKTKDEEDAKKVAEIRKKHWVE